MSRLLSLSRIVLALAALAGSIARAVPPAEDGFKPLTAWRGYVSPDTMPDGWKIEDGVISLAKGGKGLFLVTKEEFGNFDLTFEWKISESGNSGVFYRSDERHASPPHTAPEYQILDNRLAKEPRRSPGACFSVYAPAKDATKPVGEWNSARILMQSNHVEHWLNGEKIVEYELGSAAWKQHAAKSDFAAGLDFGRLARGRIALQGKGDAVWFRKFMIRVLPDLPAGGWPDRILFLGNSLTRHGPLAAIGWTNNCGMAASAPEKDYVHLLLRRFAAANGGREPVAMIENIADFERQHGVMDVGTTFKKFAEFKPDIVILQIGENVPALATPEARAKFQKAVAALLVVLKPGAWDYNPRLLVCSTFMTDKTKDEILRQVCKDAGAAGVFVDLSALGQDESNRARAERKIDHGGVGGHPGDKGMAAIADAIWKAWRLLPR